jgi:hypothetical protein
MKPKLAKPVVLFVSVEASQHERLRTMAFEAHRSMADVVRQALQEFVDRHGAGTGPADQDPIHSLVGAGRLGHPDASSDTRGDGELYGPGPVAPEEEKKPPRPRTRKPR